MKRSYLLVAMFLLIALLGSSYAEEQSKENIQIEPFGGLKWNDGFQDVVNKVAQIEGLETFNLCVRDMIDKSNCTSIKGNHDNLALAGKLGEALEKANSSLFDKERTNILTDNHHDLHFRYLGAGGQTKKASFGPYYIKASPVMISGVPFTLAIKFYAHPGVDCELPASVLMEKKGGFSFPLYLVEVLLQSSSPNLSSGKEAIMNSLNAKYGKLVLLEGKFYPDGGTVEDKQGRRLEISMSDGKCGIVYENGESYYAELEAKYQKHLASIEQERMKGKPSLGADTL